MRTRRMYFSPRKFLISTREPVSWITTLMGKWAYTDRILYLKPYVTNPEKPLLVKANNPGKEWQTSGKDSQFYTWCPYQSYTLDHILNMAADGSDCGQLLPVTPPFVHTQLHTQSLHYSQLHELSTNHWIKQMLKLKVNSVHKHLSVIHVHHYLLLFLAEQPQLQVDVVELPAQNSARSLYTNCAAFQRHIDCRNSKKIINTQKQFRLTHTTPNS